MINVKSIVSELNSLKNRAVKISVDLFILAEAEATNFESKPYVPKDEEEFGWWGITKFIFNGSRRITRTLESIDFVFDRIEEDIVEMKAAQKKREVIEVVDNV